jgi:hypothetical protein
VAVVVAVVHLGVGKVHQRLLVALAADARHAAQRQASHVFGVALAVVAARQQLVKAAHEVKQMHVGVAVLGVEDGARDHGQPVAQARVGLVVARALHGLGVQGQQGALHAGYSRISSRSMRASSNVSTASRWKGLQLSATCGWLQRRWPTMCASAAR